MDEPGLIEGYLDELALALTVDGRRARRILAETEDHLREGAAGQARAGLDANEAQRISIARFGTPAEVARRFNAEAGAAPVREWLVRMCVSLALVAGIGLLSIGIAGQVAGVLGSAIGKQYFAGSAPGTTYTAQRCSEFAQFTGEAVPASGDCEALAVDHHFDEQWRNADIALALGVVVLGAHWWARRKLRTGAGSELGPRVATALGMAAFGRRPLLLLFGIASVVASAHGYGAMYVVDGLVAMVFFAVFLRPGARSVRALAASVA